MVEPRVIVPGSVVGGYRLGKQLGHGRAGQVFLAEDLCTGGVCVLKIFAEDAKNRDEAFARFVQEARIATDVWHRNLSHAYKFEQHEGASFMMLDYLEHGTLAEHLAANGPAPVELVISTGSGLASALHRLHCNGVVHRDVKPENVMLARAFGDRLCPVLIDLGIAHVDARYRDSDRPLTSPGQALGTRGYMSSAQLCGSPAEAADDMFSLAVVLYELATGRLPWQRDNETRYEYMGLSDVALYKRQTETRVVDPRRHVRCMRRGFAEALVWPLVASSKDRPRDVREYLLALADEAPERGIALSGREIVALETPELLQGTGDAHSAYHRPRGVLRRIPSRVALHRVEILVIAIGATVGAAAALIAAVLTS